jgi:glucose/arabinose dehydrogenase
MVPSRRTLLAVVAVLALLLAQPSGAIVLPADFTDALVTAVSAPTDIAFTPDGRLLITQQTGSLRVVQNGSLLTTPALSFGTSSICTNSERGLLGVAVDPAFATNHRIYVYYTFKKADSSCVNRVSRFILPDSNVVDPATQTVLLDNMRSTAGNHNGGDLHFGPDGYLYVSIGDGGCDYTGGGGCGGANDASRDQNELLGKILRITGDGDIPPTNPFQGAGTARCNTAGETTPGLKCQETFAWGFRNPFRFAFDPNGTRFFVNDVGQDAWEEIDLGQSGADYGWNCREGKHTNNTSGPCNPTPAGMIDPIFEYPHSGAVPGTSVSGCESITGGAFVPNGLWPGYDGAYLFADYICGAIFKLGDAGASGTVSSFATSLGGSSAVAMVFGPYQGTQALYYTTYAGGGQVRRISRNIRDDGPLDFFTVTPCRVVDTRGTNAPALAAGSTRTFGMTGFCGVPPSARAVAANVTVVPATAGFLAFRRADEAPGNTSTINFPAGVNRANNAVLPLGAGGDVAVFCGIPSGSVELILDIVGYFD